MSSLYHFPVSNPVYAMKVTSPNFKVDLFEQNLYVNLDELRAEDTIKSIKTDLGIINNELTITNDYEAILLSGHRGCGKTSELKKLHNEINSTDKYVSIFISVEEELEYDTFSQPKLYFLLLSKLVERMQKAGISADITSLNELTKILTQEKKLETTQTDKKELEAHIEKNAGISFWSFLKVEGGLKASWSKDKEMVTKVTHNIELNFVEFVQKINVLLVDVRQAFIDNNIGKDILFIIDGSEKIPFEEYKKIFVTNANSLKQLSANVLIAVSIQAWYEIGANASEFSNKYLLPMLNTTLPNYISLMKETIGKRINLSERIQNDALEFIIKNAGGCIRQMYILANYTLNMAGGEIATLVHAKKAIYKEGQRLYEQLNSEHFKALKKVNCNENTTYGDKVIVELLYGLQLLKYNGNSMVNPVITAYMKDKLNIDLDAAV
jgi:energy-coupling factor transporter ATP-binding protein EcfA2